MTNNSYKHLLSDRRYIQGFNHFNQQNWYEAHDAFEDLWHELQGPERRTIQGILQIAVGQLHLQGGNLNGATILFGEAVGRLKKIGTPDLGLDINYLCELVENRLHDLQSGIDPKSNAVPFLKELNTRSN